MGAGSRKKRKKKKMKTNININLRQKNYYKSKCNTQNVTTEINWVVLLQTKLNSNRCRQLRLHFNIFILDWPTSCFSSYLINPLVDKMSETREKCPSQIPRFHRDVSKCLDLSRTQRDSVYWGTKQSKAAVPHTEAANREWSALTLKITHTIYWLKPNGCRFIN